MKRSCTFWENLCPYKNVDIDASVPNTTSLLNLLWKYSRENIVSCTLAVALSTTSFYKQQVVEGG